MREREREREREERERERVGVGGGGREDRERCVKVSNRLGEKKSVHTQLTSISFNRPT